ncbi:hypothetical protein POTOM_062012 (chloroplast) [Populus tomentosa]|uniref:Photosystem I assembly protein Ycf3 n=1 Tax=Populus tomentosa TaxID=118781 RepID=A0A8X7XNG4_POPTO|nr:hypothetical protein POTOM_062012 [Populus tomentosa]
MPRSRITGNLIDKTFSIVANILLRIIPTTSGEKEAFTYYRDGPQMFQLSILALSEKVTPMAMGYVLQETLKYGSKGRNLLAYSDRGEQAIRQGDSEIAEAWFDQAAEYWKQAIALTPGNYIEAQNWLKITRRFE